MSLSVVSANLGYGTAANASSPRVAAPSSDRAQPAAPPAAAPPPEVLSSPFDAANHLSSALSRTLELPIGLYDAVASGMIGTADYVYRPGAYVDTYA